MESKINAKIQEVIKKEMPQHVGDALKQRLADADNLERRNKELIKDFESLEKNYDKAKDDLAKTKAKLKTQKETDARIKELQTLEDAKWKSDMENQLSKMTYEKLEAEKRADEVKSVVGLFTANAGYRKSVMTNLVHAPGGGYTDNNGNWINHPDVKDSETTNTTTTEE